MKDFNKPLNASTDLIVTESKTAEAVKSGSLKVLATPVLLALMEEATCLCAEPVLEENETTVGTNVSVSHIKASGIGEAVCASATLENADGRRLTFSVSAVDSKGDVIGKGTIERFVVNEVKFMERVNGK